MPITKVRPSSAFQVGSALKNEINLTAVASDKSMGDIPIPSNIKGTIIMAFLEFRATVAYGSAIDTLIDGDQYIQISDDSGVSWHNAIKIDDEGLGVPTANWFSNPYVVLGNIDISAYVASGGTLNVQWANGLAKTGTFTFKFVQTTLHIVTA